MKKVLITIIAAICSGGAFAQTSSATWNLTSNGNASVSGNVTASSVSKGPGARSGGISAMTYGSNGVSSTNWIGYSYLQFDISSPYYNKDYYQYTVSPASGNSFTVNSITYAASSSTASPSYFAYYSLDGFTTYTSLGSRNATSHTGLNINVPAGSTFTLRVYGMDLVSTATAFRNKSVVISGSSTPTCTPQTVNNPQSVCQGGSYSINRVDEQGFFDDFLSMQMESFPILILTANKNYNLFPRFCYPFCANES